MLSLYANSLQSKLIKFSFTHLRSVTTQEKLCKIAIAQGELVGKQIILPSKKTYYSYQGIPYAKPPVGKLRFKPPQPAESWSGVRDATKEGNVCPQKDPISGELVGDEDCLFINVYTPACNSDDLLPVMVYIHGGAYAMGSGNTDLYGPDYLVQENVIVVTFNYRLAALGFLTLDTPDVPGNAGLRDQIEALKWIQRNIKRFGGDPNNVTLFGESAGAACAHFLHLSPMGKGLFKRLILQSGNALMEWSCNRLGIKRAHMTGQFFGCNSNNPVELLDFLQTIPTFDLVLAYLQLNTPDERRRGLPIPFAPTVEKHFTEIENMLPAYPLDILKSGNYDKIPIMFGYNNCEGMAFLKVAKKKLDETNDDFERMIPKFLKVEQHSHVAQNVAQEIKYFYFGNQPVSKETLPQLLDLLTDYNFAIGTHQMAHLFQQLDIGPAYFYKFSHDGCLNLFKQFFGDTKIPGACHGDDMFYIFKSKFINEKPIQNSVDERVQQAMVKMWTNFAKLGEPTPVLEENDGVKWDPITRSSLKYMDINNGFKLSIDPDIERIKFWKNLYAKYNGDFTNAHPLFNM